MLVGVEPGVWGEKEAVDVLFGCCVCVWPRCIWVVGVGTGDCCACACDCHDERSCCWDVKGASWAMGASDGAGAVALPTLALRSMGSSAAMSMLSLSVFVCVYGLVLVACRQ